MTSANRTIAFGVGDSFSEIGGGTVTNWGYFQDRVFYAGLTASSDHDHGLAAVFGNDAPSGKRINIRVDAAGDNSYNVNTVTGDQMLIAHNSDGLVVGLHDGAAIRFAGGFGSTKHRFSFGLGADNGIDAVQVTGGIGITEPIVRRGANRPIIFSNEESNYSLDTGATLTLYNFSGLVIINHWQTGAVSCWCVGGGSAVKIGDTGNTPITGVQSGNNYVFTSTYGATSTFSVTAIRTRLAA